jgi:hypothetical protein
MFSEAIKQEGKQEIEVISVYRTFGTFKKGVTLYITLS